MDDDEEFKILNCVKRRKLCIKGSFTWNCFGWKEKKVYKHKIKIFHLPPEIIEHILKFVSCKDLALFVRLTCHHFNEIVVNVLNNKFFLLNKKIRNALIYTRDMLSRAKYNLPIRRACRLLNFVEILTHQYSLIEACIWRYVRLEHSPPICMYAGSLLDLFYKIVNLIYHKPKELKIVNKKCPQIEKLCQLTKLFLNFFERNTEQKWNKSCLVSGAKLCDILDCACFAERTVLKNEYKNGICDIKIKYRLCYTWFTAVQMSARKEMSKHQWAEKQRLMYMRTRRIVNSHTNIYLEQSQWEREVLFTAHSPINITQPLNSIYAGYGEICGYLFYYGTLSKGAFEEKTKPKNQTARNESAARPEPYLDVHVELSCSVQFSPLQVYRKYLMNFENVYGRGALNRYHLRRKAHFDMKIDFYSSMTDDARLDPNYTFRLSHKEDC